MANLGLFYPNRCQPGLTVGGGSWLSALPAANVCDPTLAKVARSSDAATDSTKIRVDFGSARALRAFAIVNHNLSADATWRVLLGTTAGGSDVYAGTLATWIDAAFEAGLVAQGMEDGEYLRSGRPAIIVLPSFYTAQHLTIEIADSTNADGYVQIGRVFAGGGFVPTYNASYGLQDGWEDLSTKDASENGSLWATARRRLKRVQFVLDFLTLEEAATMHEMQRTIGTIDEVLYVPDIGNPADNQRYGMLGTLSELSALAYPYSRARSLPLAIKEKG